MRFPGIVKPNGTALRINCGSGGDAGHWLAQTPYVSGGTPNAPGTTGLELNAPILPGRASNTSVYGTGQIGTSTATYTITGLRPLYPALVRVHAHDFSAGAGVYKHSINTNGVEAVAAYDIRTFAGAASTIGIKEFSANADANGSLAIQFIAVSTFNLCVQALEIHQLTDFGYREFIISGDSLVEAGGPVSAVQAFPSQMAQDWNILGIGASDISSDLTTFNVAYDDTYPILLHTLGVSGHRIPDQIALISTRVNAYDTYPWKQRYFVSLAGHNDIVDGVSAATIQTRITTLFSTLTGAYTKKGIGTILPSNAFDSGMETIRQTVNTWILANSLGLDFTFDWVALEPRLSNPSNLTYCYDGTHQTVAGNGLKAAVVRQVFEAL